MTLLPIIATVVAAAAVAFAFRWSISATVGAALLGGLAGHFIATWVIASWLLR